VTWKNHSETERKFISEKEMFKNGQKPNSFAMSATFQKNKMMIVNMFHYQ
jgi:hypothetical protein